MSAPAIVETPLHMLLHTPLHPPARRPLQAGAGQGEALRVPRSRPEPRWRLGVLAWVLAGLGGCASLGAPSAVEEAAGASARLLGQAPEDFPVLRSEDAARQAAERAAGLLREPLDAERAVRVALLAHRGLQVQLAGLGLSEAERLQATAGPNLHLSLARLRQGEERELESSLSFDLGRWLLRPWVADLEDARLSAQRQQLSLDVLAHTAEVRQAFYAAVAAAELARALATVQHNAEAGAELARRMQAAGNFSPLQQAREQAFAAEARLNLRRAELAAFSSRERLARALGVAPQAIRLPERLPELPATLRELPDLAQQALAERLDVRAAREQTERSARQLGAVRPIGFINGMELGYMRSRSNEAPVKSGWELSFELPVFDWGGPRKARAEAIYTRQLHEAAQTAHEAASQVREAAQAWRSSWEVARQYREELLPLAQRISDQNLLRYNGMLIGVFELLADARAQTATVTEAIQAQRDFWLAQVALEQALRGPARVPALGGGASPSRAADAGGGH